MGPAGFGGGAPPTGGSGGALGSVFGGAGGCGGIGPGIKAFFLPPAYWPVVTGAAGAAAAGIFGFCPTAINGFSVETSWGRAGIALGLAAI